MLSMHSGLWVKFGCNSAWGEQKRQNTLAEMQSQKPSTNVWRWFRFFLKSYLHSYAHICLYRFVSFLCIKVLIGLQRTPWPRYPLSVFWISPGYSGSPETLAVYPRIVIRQQPKTIEKIFSQSPSYYELRWLYVRLGIFKYFWLFQLKDFVSALPWCFEVGWVLLEKVMSYNKHQVQEHANHDITASSIPDNSWWVVCFSCKATVSQIWSNCSCNCVGRVKLQG